MSDNLVQHRSTRSAFARRTPRPDVEQWLAAVGAGACFAAALRRRSWGGLCLAMAGGALAWWAAADRFERAALVGRLWSRAEDEVEEASQDSFPASDAPARTGATGMGTRRVT